jgi:hypothetical protein
MSAFDPLRTLADRAAFHLIKASASPKENDKGRLERESRADVAVLSMLPRHLMR